MEVAVGIFVLLCAIYGMIWLFLAISRWLFLPPEGSTRSVAGSMTEVVIETHGRINRAADEYLDQVAQRTQRGTRDA